MYSLNFIVPSNIDLTSEKPNKVENIAHMKYEGGWNKQIPLDEIPKEILDRIHELGLKFKELTSKYLSSLLNDGITK